MFRPRCEYEMSHGGLLMDTDDHLLWLAGMHTWSTPSSLREFSIPARTLLLVMAPGRNPGALV